MIAQDFVIESCYEKWRRDFNAQLNKISIGNPRVGAR